MKILAHIHTFNDGDVIDLCLRSIMNQTCPVNEIVLVDNASTDNTLKRSFPSKVKIIRHSENLGTSGAVISGMKYALEHRFDWLWVFDADSAPRSDALEKLLAFHKNIPTDMQEKVQVLSGVPFQPDEPYHGNNILTSRGWTARGWEPAKLSPNFDVYECHAVIWSGSLFNVSAIRIIGLPSPDYVLDWGEFAYGYQGMLSGYKAYVIQSSVFDHNTGGGPSGNFLPVKWGPLSFSVPQLPAIRVYYLVRNEIYFWLYEYREPTCPFYLRFLQKATILAKHILKLLYLLQRRIDVKAYARGIWDGLMKNMHRRY